MARWAIVGMAVMIAALFSIIMILLLTAGPTAPPVPPGPAPNPPPAASCTDLPLLGPDDFEGSWEALGTTTFSGPISTFHGTIALSNASREVVAQALPPNWELALPDSGTACHPVLILFGLQTNFRFFADVFGEELEEEFDGEYTELMVLIPFVQRPAAGTKMHTFAARMLLDDPVAEQIGNDVYGYAKKAATFDDAPPMFTALTVPSASSMMPLPAVRAMVTNPGTWQPFASAGIPTLSTITTILEMPIVGIKQKQSTTTNPSTTGDVCSYFELDYAAEPPASVRTVEVYHQYLQELAPGMSAWQGLGLIGNAPGGAIQVRDVDWKLRYPITGTCDYDP